MLRSMFLNVSVLNTLNIFTESVIAAVNEYLEDQEKDFYLEGISKLEQRWTKCIALKGGYIEK